MAIESVGSIQAYNTATSAYTEKRNYEEDRATGTASNAVELHISSANNNAAVNPQQTEDEKNPFGKDNQENHIKSAISVANQKIKMTNTRCEFEYHDATKRVSIKVVDKETEEVIREIPPEETLEMVEKMWELAGLFIDERR